MQEPCQAATATNGKKIKFEEDINFTFDFYYMGTDHFESKVLDKQQKTIIKLKHTIDPTARSISVKSASVHKASH